MSQSWLRMPAQLSYTLVKTSASRNVKQSIKALSASVIFRWRGPDISQCLTNGAQQVAARRQGAECTEPTAPRKSLIYRCPASKASAA
jgi:hypothetical protein